jgi:transcriptional regulator with XRE-family HTH domain
MPTNNRPDWQVKLGQGIRNARIKMGWKQRDLALELGYKDAESISSFETGAKAPTTDVLRQIVALLKADFVFDGCRICVESFPQTREAEAPKQLPFNFGQALVYRGAVVEVTATPTGLTIKANMAA